MGRSPKHPKSDDKYWEIGYHTLVKRRFPRSGLVLGSLGAVSQWYRGVPSGRYHGLRYLRGTSKGP